jgi:hypothetical protein
MERAGIEMKSSLELYPNMGSSDFRHRKRMPL